MATAKYVDGFVLAVPKKNMAAYRKLATIAGKVWPDHGALEYRECVGEDIAVKFGVPFSKNLKLKRGEVPVFSWIGYKSRKHRDQVNAKVMADKRLAGMDKKMPFDVKRMVHGGFDVMVGY
ncbi:MAG: DUF1428 domain-containing protein [Rhodospirillales bacterium]